MWRGWDPKLLLVMASWLGGLALASQTTGAPNLAGAAIFAAGSLGWAALWHSAKRKRDRGTNDPFSDYWGSLMAGMALVSLMIAAGGNMNMAPNRETAMAMASGATLVGAWAIWNVTKSTLRMDRHLKQEKLNKAGIDVPSVRQSPP